MVQQVVYDVSMRDKLSAGLDNATRHVQHLQDSLRSAGGLVTGLAAGFGIFKGLEFIGESTEAYEKLQVAQGQVEAGLISTGYAAGLTSKELDESAEKLSHSFSFTKDQIADMQSIIVTFPKITKQTFGDATQAIIDMSTRMHQSLDTTAVMVGKALQDPEKGITAMRRVGVNFNETQTEMVKHLVETGQAAKAQAFILAELNNEFAGSAQAAANVDPLFQYKKAMEDTQLVIGEAAEKIMKDLEPALIKLMGVIKSGAIWIANHIDLIKELAAGLAAAYTAFKLASIGASMFGTELALTTGPIGLVVAAIGLIAAGWLSARDAQQAYLNIAIENSKKVRKDEKDDITTEIAALRKKNPKLSEKDATATIAGMEANNITQTLSENQAKLDAVTKSFNDEKGKKTFLGIQSGKYKELKAKMEGLQNIHDDLKSQLAAATDIQQHGLIPNASSAKPDEPEKKEKKDKTKATAAKSVTINVSIKELIGIKDFNTTNIRDGISKVKEQVVAVMTSAVNDFQIVAGE